MSAQPPVPPEGGLGALLREARERAGLDLAAVADRTNVRKAYLEALEAEDMGALPEAVYARNFLRLYARTVGVDPGDALARFDALRARRAGHATGTFRTDAGTPQPAATDRAGAERDDVVPRPRHASEARTAPRRAAGPGAGAAVRPASALVRQLAPLVMTLVLAGVLVGTAVWGFNRLLFRPDRAPTSATAPATTGETAGPDADAAADGAADAPAAGLAAPVLPGGDALPDEILLSIESDPPGAEVSVDAFPLPGTTPIEDVPVTAREERTVRVTREGYLPFEGTFDMTRNRTLQVELEPVPGPEGAAAPAPEAGVVVEVREATWLEAYQSTARGEGERLVYTTAQPGERFVFSRPLYLHLGNAGGVEVSVDGEPIGALGSGGAVTGRAFPAP